MACAYVRFMTTPRRPDGFYVCSPPGATERYEPPLADLREWCLTSAGNPDCPRLPKRSGAVSEWPGFWIPPMI